jgi:hypothetical protein
MKKNFILFNNIKIKFYLTVLIFIVNSLFNRASGQTGTQTYNDSSISFSEYDVSCYCEVSGTSPAQILKLDNNGDIVLRLLKGKTEKEITVRYNQSQLELLREFRLLKHEDDFWKTNFPILGETRTLELREEARQTAEKLGALLKQDVINLAKALSNLKREKNTYSILFSYVLDELVWRKFIKLGYMQERTITAENPLWSGVIWAVYPPRKFSCGTNKISDKREFPLILTGPIRLLKI